MAGQEEKKCVSVVEELMGDDKLTERLLSDCIVCFEPLKGPLFACGNMHPFLPRLL